MSQTVHTEVAAEFRPAWWLRGLHRQTVWRSLFGRGPAPPYRRERFETSDGDFVDLDWFESESRTGDRPLVIVLHGLEGSSRSNYVVGLLREAARRGWDGVAMNFRSCSGELNRLPRFYHSGETGDLDEVLASLIARRPGHSIGLVGYSLGGNVLLKWLGERGDKAPESLRAAVAVSVPFDLAAAAYRVDHGLGWFYGQAFLRTLKEKALSKARRYPGFLDPDEVASIRSFALFDDRVTAPLHGFANAQDYWTRSSAASWLGAIQKPTLLINACDDPFLPAVCLPRDAVARSPWLTAQFTPRGGHAGFVEGRRPGAVTYWVDHRAMAFLDSVVCAGGRTGHTS
ncbi:MAG: alpha/beta fold hydrolase [Nitrospirae bacterium]|nr:alpha/beta fold hydrolase [Nitrospirota bacterium]